MSLLALYMESRSPSDLREQKSEVTHTMGLTALSKNNAVYDSIVVERIKKAGRIIIGTTNTPALGHIIKTDNMLLGATATPFDLTKSAGESSGGPATAVATGSAGFGTGSDIGGSLRVPASYFNIIGMKLSFGYIPVNSPVDAFNTHSPFAGPIGRSVQDVAIALDIMSDIDQCDPFSVPAPDFILSMAQGGISPPELSVAYSPGLGIQPVSPVVKTIVADAVETLDRAGAEINRVTPDPPNTPDLRRTYYAQVGEYFAAVAKEVEVQYDVDLETTKTVSSLQSTISLSYDQKPRLEG